MALAARMETTQIGRNNLAESAEEAVIRQWLESSPSETSDLHIDRVNPAWKQPSMGRAGGAQALEIASRLRETLFPASRVAVVFSLKASAKPTVPQFRNWEDVEKGLDWSPPSLYLFRTGQEPWRKSRSSYASVEEINSAIFADFHPTSCVVMSWPGSVSGKKLFYRSLAISR
jgi:hypothetical protein